MSETDSGGIKRTREGSSVVGSKTCFKLRVVLSFFFSCGVEESPPDVSDVPPDTKTGAKRYKKIVSTSTAAAIWGRPVMCLHTRAVTSGCACIHERLLAVTGGY